MPVVSGSAPGVGHMTAYQSNQPPAFPDIRIAHCTGVKIDQTRFRLRHTGSSDILELSFFLTRERLIYIIPGEADVICTNVLRVIKNNTSIRLQHTIIRHPLHTCRQTAQQSQHTTHSSRITRPQDLYPTQGGFHSRIYHRADLYRRTFIDFRSSRAPRHEIELLISERAFFAALVACRLGGLAAGRYIRAVSLAAGWDSHVRARLQLQGL